MEHEFTRYPDKPEIYAHEDGREFDVLSSPLELKVGDFILFNPELSEAYYGDRNKELAAAGPIEICECPPVFDCHRFTPPWGGACWPTRDYDYPNNVETDKRSFKSLRLRPGKAATKPGYKVGQTIRLTRILPDQTEVKPGLFEIIAVSPDGTAHARKPRQPVTVVLSPDLLSPAVILC